MRPTSIKTKSQSSIINTRRWMIVSSADNLSVNKYTQAHGSCVQANCLRYTELNHQGMATSLSIMTKYFPHRIEAGTEFQY